MNLPGSEELLDKYSDLLSNQAQIFYGKTYTLPYNLTTYGFVVNKDLFEASGLTEDDYPKTWDEVVDVAKTITEASDGQAFGFGIAKCSWTISSFTHGRWTISAIMDMTMPKTFAYSTTIMIKAMNKWWQTALLFLFETLDADMLKAQFSAGIWYDGCSSFDVAVCGQFPAQIDWEVMRFLLLVETPPYKTFVNLQH